MKSRRPVNSDVRPQTVSFEIMLIRLSFVVLLGTTLAFQESQRHLPPPLEAKRCEAPRSKDEFPKARFARKGGRETKASVLYVGNMLTVAGIEQGRDLGRYNRLNLSNPKPMLAIEMDRAPIVVSARAFLWDHWHNQKPAYLTMTGSSVDATSTSHVFVEPDETGRWRVAWRIVRHTGEIDDLPTYYSVEWVRPNGWEKPGSPLRHGEEPDPKKHELEFRDKCGDVEQSL